MAVWALQPSRYSITETEYIPVPVPEIKAPAPYMNADEVRFKRLK